MKFESPDITADNVEKIAALFPSAISEKIGGGGGNAKLRRCINFDMLRTILGDDVADDEAYEFTWVGKKEAVMEAGRPIRKTLRPCIEESKNWDTTENLYIEGDNLDVLKLLQESYLGKVKMIYIDPPYNTGNDFVYRDNFTQDKVEYEEEAGVYDEDGDRLFRNTESNGRFHSDWCSMMYPRLVLARNLLRDDGVIFISIDDEEVDNLKKICNEVFGESNFVAKLTISTGASQNGEGVKIQKNVEYAFVYSKNYEKYEPIKIDEADKSLRSLADAPSPLSTRLDMGYTIYFNPKTNNMVPLMDYDKSKVSTNDETQVYTDNQNLLEQGYIPVRPGIKNNVLHRWRWGFDTFSERKNEITMKLNGKGKYSPYFEQCGYLPPKNLLSFGVGTSGLKNLFEDNRIFDFPKSAKYIMYLLSITVQSNDIILDFFSGSATTAHAVMQLNAEDNGNRKFIMVQLPEITDETSEAHKAGYKNICEIGKERIRRAGEKIKEENKDKEGIGNLDIGFRVLKLDDSNMKDVYYSAGEYKQSMLFDMESNIKEDRTDLDLLYGCLLDLGVSLSMPHVHEEIDGVTSHTYNGGDLIACFSEKISENVVKEIAKRQPLRVVFRDSSFSNSPAKINVEEIFKLMSPNTTVKVI